MSSSRLLTLVAALIAFGWFSVDPSWAQGPGRQGGGCGGQRMMCQDRFDSLDTSKDGQVDLGEFMAVSHRGGNAEQIFKSRDANGDGVLTKEEFCAGKGMRRGMMKQ